MKRYNLNLTEADYNHAIELLNNHKPIANFIETLCPDDIRDGYGYYGCNKPIDKDGTKYITIYIGDSCD